MAEDKLRIEWRDDALFVCGSPAARLRAVARVRRAGGSFVLRVRRDGYVIDPSGAGLLVEFLNEANVIWDDGARMHVERARDRVERQVAGKAAVDAGLVTGELDALELGVKLDDHQREAAAAIALPGLPGFALFDEQGTGKTISALAGFALLRARGEVDRMLVVAPKSMLGTWADEATRVLGGEVRVATSSGASRARRAALRTEHDIAVVNYEAAVADELQLRLLFKVRRYLLVVDESYFAKNPERRRSQALGRLRALAARAVVLSGTPAPNAAWDVVNQINLADGGVAFGATLRPREVAEARARVAAGLARSPHLRRLKVEVLPDIPEQEFAATFVPMQPRQRDLYVRAANTLALELRAITDAAFARNLSSYMARLTALLQICSHPGGIDPLYDEVPAKLLALDRLLEALIVDRGEKVVLWSWFRHSIDAIARRYEHYGVVRVDGSVTRAALRTEAVRRFQADPEVRLFVGNPGAAGAGITLTAAATAIYESMSNQAAHYMQSIDRIHRRGQRRGVRHLILLCDNTVEAAEYERLTDKQRDARELLGDSYREPPTRTALLAELEASLR